MKKVAIGLILVLIILAAFVILSLQKPPEEEPEIPENEMNAITDTIVSYYRAKPYEEGFLNKSEAEVYITLVEGYSGDSATVAVTLDWEKAGHTTAAVFILQLQKQDGKWTVVSEELSIPG